MISRGIPAAGEAVPLAGPRESRDTEPCRPPPSVPGSIPCQPPASDAHLVDYRLAALERLTRLRDKGALSAEEFESEKALVLRIPATELMLQPEQAIRRRGPSLLGRLFNWKLLAAGLVAGLAFSWFTAPQDLIGLVDKASRLIS